MFGGYILSGGHLFVLAQPFEFLIIGGAAIGGFVTANRKPVLKAAGGAVAGLLKGEKYDKNGYLELLSLLYSVFKLAKIKGALALAEIEEQKFAAAEFALRQAIRDIPDLKNLADNLIIDRTPEGLRIQIVDQDKLSMFPLGSAEMADSARKLIALVSQVVKRLPNKLSITGHTDARPYATVRNYGNWELSADRANASRRELLIDGLPPERIEKVVGMAEPDPLVPEDRLSARNRRISIVLMREAGVN